jgi:hypothetical protein
MKNIFLQKITFFVIIVGVAALAQLVEQRFCKP